MDAFFSILTIVEVSLFDPCLNFNLVNFTILFLTWCIFVSHYCFANAWTKSSAKSGGRGKEEVCNVYSIWLQLGLHCGHFSLAFFVVLTVMYASIVNYQVNAYMC